MVKFGRRSSTLRLVIGATARRILRFVVAQLYYDIPAHGIGAIVKTVLVSVRCKAHRAGSQPGCHSVYEEIHLSHQHDEHLFVDVLVRWVWSAARGQLRFVHFDRKIVVQIPLEHGTRFVHAARAAGLDREFVEFISLRGKVGGLRLNACCSKGWKKES